MSGGKNLKPLYDDLENEFNEFNKLKNTTNKSDEVLYTWFIEKKIILKKY